MEVREDGGEGGEVEERWSGSGERGGERGGGGVCGVCGVCVWEGGRKGGREERGGGRVRGGGGGEGRGGCVCVCGEEGRREERTHVLTRAHIFSVFVASQSRQTRAQKTTTAYRITTLSIERAIQGIAMDNPLDEAVCNMFLVQSGRTPDARHPRSQYTHKRGGQGERCIFAY